MINLTYITIPNDILANTDILTTVNAAIADLQGSVRSQTDIDIALMDGVGL